MNSTGDVPNIVDYIEVPTELNIGIGWVKDGDYIFPPDATEEQKAEIKHIIDKQKKEKQILQLLKTDKKIEALVKQANLTRQFLIAVWKHIPQNIKKKVNAENKDLMQELVRLNNKINKILEQ